MLKSNNKLKYIQAPEGLGAHSHHKLVPFGKRRCILEELRSARKVYNGKKRGLGNTLQFSRINYRKISLFSANFPIYGIIFLANLKLSVVHYINFWVSFYVLGVYIVHSQAWYSPMKAVAPPAQKAKKKKKLIVVWSIDVFAVALKGQKINPRPEQSFSYE